MSPKKKTTWKTGAAIIAIITFLGVVLALLNDAFELFDRFITRPEQITEPTNISSNDPVLSTFPFFIGNTWEYSFGTRTNASPPEHPETVNETGKYTTRVVNVETFYEGRVRVFYLEVSPPASNYAGFIFNAPCGSQSNTSITYMIVTDGKYLYEVCDRIEMLDIASNLMGRQGKISIGPTFILPLKSGMLWPYYLDLPPRDDTAYQWYVEAQMDIIVPVGNFKNCFKIIFSTLSDSKINFVCPGIGLVASEYHHYGAIVDYRAELTSYNFVSKP